ncbi:MAG: glycosyltransferase [Bdellovibrionales bacterium]
MIETTELDILIPVVNEVENLKILKKNLDQQIGVGFRVIIADGGSTDGSIELVKSFDWKLVMAKRGRAKQLNAGLDYLSAPYCLILHADCCLEVDDQLQESLIYLKEKTQSMGHDRVAGHWGLKFIRTNKEYPWAFRYPEEKSEMKRRFVVNGDQGFLLSTRFLKSDLKSFNEDLGFMEDQEMADRIFLKGNWLLLPNKILTSGRRFESEGFHQRYILMSIMMGLYWCGVNSFFVRAPEVYKLQQSTSKLNLWPFFKVIWKLMIFDLGLKNSITTWYKVGTYVREQSWQLFFFVDIALRNFTGPKKYPFVKFHDKVFYPLTNHRVGNVINSFICFFYFMLILGPYFFLTEIGSNKNA